LNAPIISDLKQQFHVTNSACLARKWRIERIGEFGKDYLALRDIGAASGLCQRFDRRAGENDHYSQNLHV